MHQPSPIPANSNVWENPFPSWWIRRLSLGAKIFSEPSLRKNTVTYILYLKAAHRSSPPVCLPLYSTHTSQKVSFHLCILKLSTSIKLYIFKICLALAIFLKIPYEWAGYNHFSLLLQKECLNHTTRYCNKETYLLWMISKKDTFVSMILLNLPVGTLLF